MTRERNTSRRKSAALAVVSGLALGAQGCGSSVVSQPDAGTTSGGGGAGGNGQTTQSFIGRLATGGIDEIDLLLMIDNSRSMADKQQILVQAVPDLVRGLVSPPCIDANGATASQPAGPLDPCPAGTKRRFRPITDIHIGVVTSSIGGHGSDACPDSETSSCPGGATNTSNNDKGHLVSRLDPCSNGMVPSYQGKGFLAWDPTGKDMPPGEADIGQIATTTNPDGTVSTLSPGLVPSLKDLALGAGQIGCGYEASMESWYRFLVDPDPYQTIVVDTTLKATPQGVDDVLLQQRKDFLRPSSLLAIIGLTDENDCSIKEYGQFYFAAQQRDPGNPNKNFYLPKARSECATNPNDQCCRSCGQDQTGCPPDPNCNGSLDATTDDVNLRCFDQKRRFGIDFLYPIDRYVTALTQPLVPDRMGNMVPNPIFSVLDPTNQGSAVRDPTMVMLAYVTGVPWQDLARDPKDASKGFKNAAEMSMPNASGHSTWDYVIGDPANYVAPLDPHMIESSAPRSGVSPITGDAIAPPSTAPGPGSDKINGHEYTPGTKNGVQVAPDDLEYACIFPLGTPRDCSLPNIVGSCDCTDPQNDNPLCEPDPNNGGNRTLQVRAKAYPGIRQLSLIKAMGPQGVAASICPAQVDDASAPSYGYRPAIQAILDRLAPAFDVSCLPKQLQGDPATGQVSCAIVEARNSGQHLDAAACESFCSGLPGRVALTGAHAALRDAAFADPLVKTIGADCVCEIPELGGQPGCSPISSALAACQCDPSDPPAFGGKPIDGWCYIDADQGIGSPELVQSCPAEDKRTLRFVGAGAPASGALAFIACAD